MEELGPTIIEKPFVYRERKRPELGNGGIQRIYEFENGYQASVVRGSYLADGWEIAVMKNGYICYDTPITDDVIGHLTAEERDKILDDISLLPKA